MAATQVNTQQESLQNQEQKVNTSFVDYTEVIIEHIQRPKHTSKTIDVEEKGQDGKVTKMQITRYRTPYKYNYAPPGRNPIVDDFYLQGSRMTTETGIQCQIKSKYKRYSMLFKFDIQDKAQNAFLDVLDRIFMASGNHLYNNRDNIGMDNLTIGSRDILEKTGFKYIVFYRKEKGVRVEGSKPSWYVDLYSGKNNKTVFTLPSSNPNEDPEILSWDDMTDVCAEMKPCFHIAFDRSGGKEAATVVYLTSAVVYSGKPAGTEARNKSSAYTSDAEEVRAAKSDFEHIRELNRKTKKQEEVVVTSDSKSSFSGLTDTKEVKVSETESHQQAPPPQPQSHQQAPTFQPPSFHPTQQTPYHQTPQQRPDMTPHAQPSHLPSIQGQGPNEQQQHNLSQLYASFAPNMTSGSEPPALYSGGHQGFSNSQHTYA